MQCKITCQMEEWPIQFGDKKQNLYSPNDSTRPFDEVFCYLYVDTSSTKWVHFEDDRVPQYLLGGHTPLATHPQHMIYASKTLSLTCNLVTFFQSNIDRIDLISRSIAGYGVSMGYWDVSIFRLRVPKNK